MGVLPDGMEIKTSPHLDNLADDEYCYVSFYPNTIFVNQTLYKMIKSISDESLVFLLQRLKRKISDEQENFSPCVFN